MFPKPFTILLSSLLVFAACSTGADFATPPTLLPSSSAPPTTVATHPLVGSDWLVAGLQNLDAVTPPPNEVTLTFDPDQKFGGNAGCNGYGAQWVWGTATEPIVVADWAITEMACEENSDWFAFLEALASSPLTVSGGGDLLTQLTADDGTIILLEPVAGFTWTDLVGMAEDQAKETTESADYVFRVVSRDGEAYAVTADYRQDRVNADIVDGGVTKITVG